jgi:hypothetical protein
MASPQALLSPPAFQFLIANPELEFLVNYGESAHYEFLIANIRQFLIAVSVAH